MYVGIDISKAKLDIAILPSGELFEVKNTPQGIAALITRLTLERPELIVFEPSGGYEFPLLLELSNAGQPVALVHALCPCTHRRDAHQGVHQSQWQASQDGRVGRDEYRAVRICDAP